MAGRDRLLALGRRRGARLALEFGDAVRELRLAQGLSRRALAGALGFSCSKLGRWERAGEPLPNLTEMATVLRVLGHDLAVKWYPVGGMLRDAGHAALVHAFLRELPAGIRRRLEAPIPLPGDLRAWDVLLQVGRSLIGVVVETNLRDWQALLRREQEKARDSGVDRLLFVLLDSRGNRRAVAQAGGALQEALPLDGRAVWRALRAGRDPGGNGLVFLSAHPRP